MTLVTETDFGASVGAYLLPTSAKRVIHKSSSHKATYMELAETSMNDDIRRLERGLEPLRAKLEQFANEANDVEMEIPETFDLQALSIKRVTIQVRESRAAPFSFAVDDDIDLDELDA